MTNAQKFHSLFSQFAGQTITTAEARALVSTEYPEIVPGSNLPTDHTVNAQGNTYCSICKEHGALFTRNGSKLTINAVGVLPVTRGKGTTKGVDVTALKARLAPQPPAPPENTQPADDTADDSEPETV